MLIIFFACLRLILWYEALSGMTKMLGALPHLLRQPVVLISTTSLRPCSLSSALSALQAALPPFFQQVDFLQKRTFALGLTAGAFEDLP